MDFFKAWCKKYDFKTNKTFKCKGCGTIRKMDQIFSGKDVRGITSKNCEKCGSTHNVTDVVFVGEFGKKVSDFINS